MPGIDFNNTGALCVAVCSSCALGQKSLVEQAVCCGDAICLAPPPCKLIISSYLFARWHLFRHVGYLRHQQQVDLWCPSHVTLDPMYATDRQDVRRQTDVRQKHRLMPPPYGARRHNTKKTMRDVYVSQLLCFVFNRHRYHIHAS